MFQSLVETQLKFDTMSSRAQVRAWKGFLQTLFEDILECSIAWIVIVFLYMLALHDTWCCCCPSCLTIRGWPMSFLKQKHTCHPSYHILHVGLVLLFISHYVLKIHLMLKEKLCSCHLHRIMCSSLCIWLPFMNYMWCLRKFCIVHLSKLKIIINAWSRCVEFVLCCCIVV